MDIENLNELQRYLEETGRIDPAERPTFQPLSGGVSNRTMLVRFPSGEAWVMKQALRKLRVPVDWFSSPERIHREAAGLTWVPQLAPPGAIPALIFIDPDHHLLAMQAVPEPYQNWKTMLLAGQINPDHIAQFGRLLATIHRRAAEQANSLTEIFADRSFFESLRLEPYYGYTAQQVPAAAPFLHPLIDETRRLQLTLVHGDYSPKNILIHQNNLILLDYEVIHFGDPAFDLGFSMTHLLSKAHHLPDYRRRFADAARQYWQTYQAILGPATPGPLDWAESLEARAVRHTLACLLARVAGRSPLEYMPATERLRQQAVTVALMAQPPARMAGLIDGFIEHLKVV